MLPIALTVFLHESAHLVALRCLGGRMRGFSPAPFGLCIAYDENSLSLAGEILVSAAGCLVNLLSAVTAVLLYVCAGVDLLAFGAVSLAIALFNLLPVFPLDGYRLLQLVCTWRCGPAAAERGSAIFSYILGFLLYVFSSYLFLCGMGTYPFLFSIFLLLANTRTLQRLFLRETEI